MLILVALMALAGPDAAAAQSQAATGARDADKQICVTKAKIGTRFKERVCFDKAEYERRQLEERKALERMQKVPYQGS